jgi:asparagine synthase (glutamine-hydrolysing)
MCGLAGFLDRDSDRSGEDILRHMAQRIAHRGPDDEGVWLDAETGIGFCHRRLSIVDLSAAGHQPMRSPRGRYHFVWNGEIYNHLALRRVLESEGEAPVWRGHSDTETLLACFENWGVVETLKQTVGMFSMALWDIKEQTLTLARDRMGEKPLYYGWSKDVFLFGSELKALKAHPKFDAELDRDALGDVLRRHYITGFQSIYRGISKVPPGCVLTVSLKEREPSIAFYWSVADAALLGKDIPFRGKDEDAVYALEGLLSDSIALQMVADVPVGAFLSGGIDSSLIVALMQSQASRPIRTFTIGFEEEAFNEAPYAAEVARHLGTDHTEVRISPRDALDVIPLLPQLYDEPMADISQVPTYLVSKLARADVTVSLSGDAGDELFGGYNTYGLAERFFRLNKALPLPFRQILGLGSDLAAPLAGAFGHSKLARQMRLAASVVGAADARETTERLLGHWCGRAVPVLGLLPKTQRTHDAFDGMALSDLERMMARDMVGYLPDDILVKVDRASMAVSLESRVPMLDHRIVEFALSLPMPMRRREGVGKWILREVLYRHVPRAMVERPKKGFGVPLAAWLRGPLRDWAADLLDPVGLRQDGLFDVEPITYAWQQHCSGSSDRHNDLWPVLVTTQWLRAG